jgi:hypothetical protein
MAVIQMSDRDLARLRALFDVMGGRLTMASASAVLAVSERHAHRLLTSFSDEANARDVANAASSPRGGAHVHTTTAASRTLRPTCANRLSIDPAMSSKREDWNGFLAAGTVIILALRGATWNRDRRVDAGSLQPFAVHSHIVDGEQQ